MYNPLTVNVDYYSGSDTLLLTVMDTQSNNYGTLKFSGAMVSESTIVQNITNIIGGAIADAVIQFRRKCNE